jgi:hypothetical protein
MNIKVKEKLIKSRNPSEYKIKLENQVGDIIQILGDGFNLVKFKQFKIRRKLKQEYLEWYIHDLDFYLEK